MRSLTLCRLIVVIALAVVFMWAMPRSALAQCTVSGGTYSCPETAGFSTSSGSLFTGSVSGSATVGPSWNTGGTAGDIVHAEACVLGFCVDLGEYGAELSGSTSGNIGVAVSAVATGGTITAAIPQTNINLQLPTAAAPGLPFNVSASGLSMGSNNSFAVTSPTVGFGVGLNLALQASAGLDVCFVSCTGSSGTLLNTSGALTLLQYNEQGPIQSATAGGQNWTVLNQSGSLLNDLINNNSGGSVDVGSQVGLAAGVLTLTANLGDNLTYTSASDPGSNTASGTTGNPVVSLNLNPLNILTEAADLPPLSGSVGDLLCAGAGGCAPGEQGLLNQVNYNLLSATASIGISPSSQYLMNTNGENIMLQVYENGAPLSGPGYTTVLSPSNNYTGYLMNPANAQGNTVTVVPTISLVNPTMTTQMGVTVTPDFTVSGLGLSAPGLDLGPLFSVSAPNVSPVSLTLDTTTTNFGGFNSVTEAATSPIAYSSMLASLPPPTTGNENQAYSGAGQVISYTSGDNLGLSTNCPNVSNDMLVCNAAVVGGTFNAASYGAVAEIGANGGSQSELIGVTINGFTAGLTGPNPSDGTVSIYADAGSSTTLNSTTINNVEFVYLNENSVPNQHIIQANLGNVTINNSAINNFEYLSAFGNVTINNSTIDGPGGSGGFETSGVVNINNSTINTSLIKVDPNTALTLNGTTGTLGLFRIGNEATVSMQSSSLTVGDSDPRSSGPGTTLDSGAQLSLYNSSLTTGTLYLNPFAVLNIGAGSTLQTGAIQIDGGNNGQIINIVSGGTLNVGSTFVSPLSVNNTTVNGAPPIPAVNNSGGTVNLSGVTGSGVNIYNQAALIPAALGSGGPGGVVNIYASIFIDI
jgi:hypothetical protein